MLKWAVNTPRVSYLTVEDSKADTEILQLKTLSASSPGKLNTPNEIISTQTQTLSAKRQRLKRKPSDIYLSRRLQNWLDKENQVTSTPLQSNLKTHNRNGALRRLNSFKDLSNITPYDNAVSNNPLNSILSLLNTPSQSLDSNILKNNNPVNYATTLPTLEVEYSPCGPVPGPILALRGLGIADTYFDKPRYLPHNKNDETLIQIQPSFNATNSTFQCQRNMRRSLNSVRDDTASLSSSKMGDQTLERMIDAILESTRKEKKPMKFARQSSNQQQCVMSPTYTPAEDPANDLSEFWMESQNGETLLQTIRKKRRSLPASVASASIYSEREVRSPRRTSKRNIFHLRRQRAVRRKRKTSKENVKHNALKIAGSTLTNKQVTGSGELNCKQRIDNSSPDSGHNSFSELDENSVTIESNCLPIVGSLANSELRALDSTKRRLSFSNQTSIV
ncbi:uncharacterized protein LOC105212722 [Zeugodacus cucurbitae]|uniref:Enhancer of polycomb-like protein 1 n=1 Tax=Zeugodacus cucurbitae TaxID=28588 RepID=A0A0A1WNI4_ZEUCU|nr:uncharacterized protein LOC105212722 [Zeugodacus cucurbitae]